MKKLTKLLLASTLTLALLASCGTTAEPTTTDNTAGTTDTTVESGGDVDTQTTGGTLKIGATPSPHALILEEAKPLLEAKGIILEVTEYSDYALLNPALSEGSLDANYFQHLPYLLDYNENRDTSLVSVATIHYEPLGIYGSQSDSLDNIPDGAVIGVPNDVSNEARALLLLEAKGIITLKEDAGLTATLIDIVENPYNVSFTELGAAQLPISIADFDFAVIPGNYAVEHGLRVSDALATEDADSTASETYGNIIAVDASKETDPNVLALVEVLTGPEISTYISESFDASALPLH